MRTEPLTTLKRQATELLADIERDKQPVLNYAARAAKRVSGGCRDLRTASATNDGSGGNRAR